MNNFYKSTIEEADAVILAAGEFPSHPIPLHLLGQYRDRIICCDGAADALIQAGFYPKTVVGDGDSISPATRNLLSERFIYDNDRETNDLTKAFRYAVFRNYKRIVILGATGKREDHTLGNISLLTDYMDSAEVRMPTNYGVIMPVAGNAILTSYAGQQISVFCMHQSPLTIYGLKWSVENRIINRWWEATLNEALSDRFEIKTNGKVIVFQKY
jgi:thiamine pyrophosphokinase